MSARPIVASIKGAHIIGLVKALRARRKEAEAVMPRELRRYLDERVLASTWYPETDHVALRRAVAALNPEVPDIWGYFGVVAARASLAGVYKNMVAAGDPARTLRNMRHYWSLYHSGGRLETTVEEDGRARFEIVDYAAASAEMCRTLETFYAEVLRHAGAVDVTFTKLACQAAGAPRCRWEVSWRAAQKAP
jgi:hypothetical protein